ncbi:MAG: hypothetical protein ABL876_16755 [Chitinophagaceae bacterium]
MKKIFTLTLGVLFAVALMAADRRPVVTVNSSKNYKIVIDGRSYFGSDLTINLNNLSGGRHFIKVFEMKRGFYERREKLVGATTFFVDRKDIVISIDWFGNILIKEKKTYRRFGNDYRDDRRGNDRDRNDDFDRRDDKERRF